MAGSAQEDDDHSAEAAHCWLTLLPDPAHRHVAVCSCGWVSAPCPTAGLAGRVFDQHRSRVTA